MPSRSANGFQRRRLTRRSAVSQLLLETITPTTLELALDVQRQLVAQLDQADRLRKQHVERARYEAELSQQRYMQVDPNNRLVADALEGDWNAKLRELEEAQQRYEQQRQADRATMDEKQREEVHSLASDFPRLWHDKRTPQQEGEVNGPPAHRRRDVGESRAD